MVSTYAVMEKLNQRLPFFNSRFFYLLFSGGALLQPTAVLFQTYKAWTAVSIVGISFQTYVIMLILQIVGIGYSIRVKEAILMLAMGISAIGTLGILAALVLR
jgi:hypothetical protein